MTTREQIIAAAKEAGFFCPKELPSDWDDGDFICNSEEIKRFYTIVSNQVKDQCAALCYQQNWELRGEEMSEMILATKEEVK